LLPWSQERKRQAEAKERKLQEEASRVAKAAAALRLQQETDAQVCWCGGGPACCGGRNVLCRVSAMLALILWQELRQKEKTAKERVEWEAQLQVQREEEEAEKLAKLQVRDGSGFTCLHPLEATSSSRR
jgi:hypothetical protein